MKTNKGNTAIHKGTGSTLPDSNNGLDNNSQERSFNPNQCPRFFKCSAPICLLDKDWKKRTHLKGESVCFYLRSHAAGREIVDSEGVHTGLRDNLRSYYAEIKHHIPPLKKQLNRIEKAASLDGVK